MKLSIPLLILAVPGVLFAFTSCGKSERPVDAAARAGILIIGNGSEPQGLDPHAVTGVPENRIITALIEGLISYHPTDDHEPEPGVAKSWTHSADYSEWTFTLRPDARWSNGDPVTAHDFVYSWQRMLSPQFGASYAEMLYVLVNAEAFHRGERDDFTSVGVEAVDDHTLLVRLTGPTPHFLSMLKHYSWFPVHPPTIEKYGGMTEQATRWTREEYVGNGPFLLAEWSPNRIIRVTRNPHYWDRDTVRLNEIHFRPIDNQNTEEAAFRNGEIHVTGSVPPAQIAVYRRTRPEVIRMDPYLGTYFYRFNVNRPPLNDPRVRRALSMTIDRESIVENITRGEQAPAGGFTPPGLEGYPVFEEIAYDPETARRLLAEAGFPGGRNFPRLEILFNTLETHRAIAEAIQDMWMNELRIDVRLHNQEWRVYIPTVQNQEYDLSRAGWIGDYMDPITFLDMWTTGNGNNNTGWSHSEYDQLISRARREIDPEERLRILNEAEAILLRELPITPIYWYNSIYLIDPRIKNWHPKILDNRPYKYLSITP